MNTSRKTVSTVLGIVCSILCASHTYAQLTWKPQAGGYSGDWDTTSLNWTANGIDQVAYTGTQAIFAGEDGTHTVTMKNKVSEQTSLQFSNGVYTLLATAPITNKNTSAALTFTVATGKTATIGTNITFQNTMGSSPHYTILGGGTLRLETGATMSSEHNNGVFQIGKSTGTSVDADKGNLVVSGGRMTARRRIMLAIGSFNLSSGTIVLEQNSATESAFAAGTQVDSTSGDTDMTIAGGFLRASTTNSPGITIGGSSKNGGTINLNGGTLQTVSIVQSGGNSSVRKRILNLNGGTIRVDPNATQTHLDDYIKNFTGTGVGIYLLGNGITFDTSIVSNATDQIVKILSPIQKPIDGSTGGPLIKTGANTVRLSATNTYNGATLVQGGTLQLGAALAITNTPSVLLINGSSLDLSLVTGFALSKSRSQTLGGNGTVKGPISFETGSRMKFKLDIDPAGSDTLTFIQSGTIALGEMPVDFEASAFLKNGNYPIVRFGEGVTSFSGTLSIGTGLANHSGIKIAQVTNGYDLVVPSAATLIMFQ